MFSGTYFVFYEVPDLWRIKWWAKYKTFLFSLELPVELDTVDN